MKLKGSARTVTSLLASFVVRHDSPSTIWVKSVCVCFLELTDSHFYHFGPYSVWVLSEPNMDTDLEVIWNEQL